MTDQWDTEGLALFPEHDGILYLSGVSTDLTRNAHRADLGLLVTPASSVHRQIDRYPFYGADNGLYVETKAGRPFDPDRWLTWLDRLPRESCLFAALPDVLEWHADDAGRLYPVGNMAATLERSARYANAVKRLGFPAALVAQDGLKSLDQIPESIRPDAIFVGGSDDYKLGPDAARLTREAREAGLWVHVGRVNSLKRLRYALTNMEADSADGTYIGFGPTTNAPRVLGWLDELNGGPLERPRYGLRLTTKSLVNV